MPDDATEVKELLDIIYSSTLFVNAVIWEEVQNAEFRDVDMYLRMTSKYDLCGGRRIIEGILHEHWPSTLQGWDIKEDIAESKRKHHGAKIRHRSDPASFILLARRHNLQKMHPAAFYSLSLTNPLYRQRDELMDGSLHVPHRDLEWMEVKPQEENDRCARWEVLDAKELLHLERGKEQLRCKVEKSRQILRSRIKCCDDCLDEYEELVGNLVIKARKEGILHGLRNVDEDDYFADMCENARIRCY